MAFVSDTGIVNMALSHVGSRSTVENFRTEKTEEAVQARIWYDYSRQLILETYDWNFARKRAGLALHGDVISETATDPMAGVWGFRYQYPADCVKARKIQNPNAPPGNAIRFAIETSLDGEEKTILTNMEDAVLVYTFDQKATELFSALFVLGFSHLLASLMAWSLTGKRKVGLDQFTLYQSVLPTATAADANEAVEGAPREAEWIRGREGNAVSGLTPASSLTTFPDADN